MKKTISFLALSSLVLTLAVPFFGTANADLTTKKVRVIVTYPISDATLGVDAGALVHEPNSGILFRYALKDSSGTNLCMEEKTVSVVNGIMTYELGSQYAINANGVSTGCNMSGLLNNFDYKIVVTGDLNRNNIFTDTIDYTSADASWTESSSQQFEDSFLDSKTLDIQNNIGAGSSSEANIDYNINAGALNTQLIAAGQKTKTFDLNGDGAAEVFAVPQTGGDGMIYGINKVTGSLENILTSSKITIDDATNIFVSGRLGNFVLHGALGTDSAATISNISGTSIAYSNGSVVEQSQSIKEFVASDYLIVILSGKDTTFKFNPLSRLYEEQVSVPFGGAYDLYDSVVATNWAGTPFASDTADYYGGTVREADLNGTIISDIDGQALGDFNQDGRLDSITWKNAAGGMAYFTVHIRKSDGSYKNILVDILADGLTAGTSILDNSADFGGTDINEIIFTNGSIKNVYKINGAWETADVGDGPTFAASKIVSFESSFYAILAKNGGTTNVNESFFSIGDGFRDMKQSNINDKFLLIGNFKVQKDGNDYYDYSIKIFNGTEYVDLLLDDGITTFKATGNKIGFQKIANSDFYAFYVDKSTHYTKGLPDKSNLYYIHDGKISSIMTDIIVNNNNTSITEDGNLNEGGSKLLNSSTFGFFGNNLTGVDSGYFGISNANFVTGNGINNSKTVAQKETKIVTKTVSGTSTSNFTLSSNYTILKQIQFWFTYQGSASNGVFDITFPNGDKFNYTGGATSGVTHSDINVMNPKSGSFKIVGHNSGYSPVHYYKMTYEEKHPTLKTHYFIFDDGKLVPLTTSVIGGKTFLPVPSNTDFRTKLYNSGIEYDTSMYSNKSNDAKGLFSGHETKLTAKEEKVKNQFNISEIYDESSFVQYADHIVYSEDLMIGVNPVFTSGVLSSKGVLYTSSSLSGKSVSSIKNNTGFSTEYGHAYYDTLLGMFIYKSHKTTDVNGYEIIPYNPQRYNTSNVKFYYVPSIVGDLATTIKIGSSDSLSYNFKGLNLATSQVGYMGLTKYFGFKARLNGGYENMNNNAKIVDPGVYNSNTSNGDRSYYNLTVDDNGVFSYASSIRGWVGEQIKIYYSYYPLQ